MTAQFTSYRGWKKQKRNYDEYVRQARSPFGDLDLCYDESGLKWVLKCHELEDEIRYLLLNWFTKLTSPTLLLDMFNMRVIWLSRFRKFYKNNVIDFLHAAGSNA